MATMMQLSAFSGSNADRSLLEQLIHLIDGQINTLAYESYILTAEEIVLAEGR